MSSGSSSQADTPTPAMFRNTGNGKVIEMDNAPPAIEAQEEEK